MTAPDRRALGAALALSFGTVLLFGSVAHFQFINYDDDLWIVDNPHLRAGLSAATVRWAFTTFYAANYVPLTWLSLALQHAVFGDSAAGFHSVDAVLHAVNAALLLALLYTATRRPAESLAVAALFAVHPLRVESVAWASEHKDVLCATLFLTALLCYVHYTRAVPGRASMRWYVAVALLTALALLAKPMAVTLPAVLMLMDFWPLGRPLAPRLVVEKLPIVVLAAAAGWMTVMAQRAGLAVQPLSRISVSQRLANAVVSIVRYVQHIAWPSGLIVFYPYPPRWPGVVVAAGAGACLLVTVVALLRARRQPYLLVGWLWFVGMLAPVIGIVQVGRQAMADRYTYLPAIGLTFAVVWAVGDWASLGRGRSRAAVVIGVCIVAVLAVTTARQLRYWIDTPTLFEHTLAVSPDNEVAHVQLALWEVGQGMTGAARDHYTAALRIAPDDPYAHFDFGNLLLPTDPPAAAEQYRQATELDPDDARMWGNLGIALVRCGRPREAGEAFRRAAAIAPASAEAAENLRTWTMKYRRRSAR